MTSEDETVCYLNNSRMSDVQKATHFDDLATHHWTFCRDGEVCQTNIVF